MKKSMNLVDRVKDGAKGVVAGIRDNTIKYASAVADNTKKAAVYGLTSAVLLGAGAGVANAEPERIMNFKRLAGTSTGKVLYLLDDGLMELDNVIPASSVESGSHWHMGFINYVGGVINVVGEAENISRDIPGREGWMDGTYYDSIGVGNRPDDVWTVEDIGKDGIADYYPSTGTLIFDGGEGWNSELYPIDNFYYAEDIMFGQNKVYGDMNELPIYPSSGSEVYLPEMEVDSRPTRSGPSNMNDLADLSENWLCQDCHPYDNNDCNGADWNLNGVVDFVDFSHMAQGWDPNYVAPIIVPQGSPLESSALLKSADVYSTTQDESGVYVVDDVEPKSSYSIKAIKQGDEVIAAFE